MGSRIKELLYHLVSVQSDTGTKMEAEMAAHIYKIIKEDRYFVENPQLCGCFDNGDALGRPVVWALKRAAGETEKTIILNGHYDAAEIDSYGPLKPLALQPDKLRPELKKLDLSPEIRADLENPDWCFGRATADMKAGIAINLNALLAEEKRSANILFIAVCDEENIAAGMRSAVGLLLKLKAEHRLDYRLLFLTEPHVRGKDEKFLLYNGSAGKLLPCVVAKGKLSHVGLIASGLNPVRMMAEIVNHIELNAALCSEDLGAATQPPTVLYCKDSKTSYDVSIPEYASMYFNLMFLRSAPVPVLMGRIKELCAAAVKKAVPGDAPELYTFGELEAICQAACPQYEREREEICRVAEKEINAGRLCIQDAGLNIIKETIKLSKITGPVVVIGLLPPYMPATNNRYLPGYAYEEMLVSMTQVLEQKGILFEDVPYFMGLSDNSYTMCPNPEEERRVLADMVVPTDLYDVDFDSIARLSVPSVIAGPWGKDYHTIAERVYLPDVLETVPAILENVIRRL